MEKYLDEAYYDEYKADGCEDHKKETECYEEHHIVHRKKCQGPPKPAPKRPCRCGGHKFVEPTMKRTNCFPKGCVKPCCCVACRCECERPF